MKKEIRISLIIITLLFSTHLLTAQRISYIKKRMQVNSGISYNFPITTDYSSTTESFFLDVPLGIGIDLKFSDRLSLYMGADFLYGFHSLKYTTTDIDYTYYLHYLFIRIPILAKFYPMVHVDESYENFYVAAGGILHFWPVNYYYIIDHNSNISSGNSYSPGHDIMPPGNIYTPINIGIKLAIGNHFYLSTVTLLGIEFYCNYLIIPSFNGYYFGENYNRGNNIIVEFTANVGIQLSLAFQLDN